MAAATAAAAACVAFWLEWAALAAAGAGAGGAPPDLAGPWHLVDSPKVQLLGCSLDPLESTFDLPS